MINEEKFFEWIDKLSLKVIFILALVVIIIFSFIFYILTYISPENGLSNTDKKTTILTYLLFSVSSFFSASQNKIISLGISSVLSLIEIIIGYLFLAIIISKIVSFKQDKIIKSIYSLNFHKEFHEFRIELQRLRKEIRKTANQILWEDNNWKLLNRYFKKECDENYIKKISSLIRGVYFYMRREIEKTPILLSEIRDFEFERLLNSLHLSLNELKKSINKFNQKGYNWKSRYLLKKIQLLFKYVNLICDLINENTDSINIKNKIKEIKRLEKEII
ncbi:MAG: hypothetical protein DRP13_03840 [Candidatus Aenigmatarchaeota archaeon]|nr:MAG: hypothetical protein DRP13_03840 [Candidatus Aenigmarchaeota archaeon]